MVRFGTNYCKPTNFRGQLKIAKWNRREYVQEMSRKNMYLALCNSCSVINAAAECKLWKMWIVRPNKSGTIDWRN